jgi:hypothetical protein
MSDQLTTLRAALELLDAQWQCSRLWSMEEAQDCSETLRDLIASMEAQEPVNSCDTCAHFKPGKNPLVEVYEIECFECSQYFSDKWVKK